jgi:hypothetical protein
MMNDYLPKFRPNKGQDGSETVLKVAAIGQVEVQVDV